MRFQTTPSTGTETCSFVRGFKKVQNRFLLVPCLRFLNHGKYGHFITTVIRFIEPSLYFKEILTSDRSIKGSAKGQNVLVVTMIYVFTVIPKRHVQFFISFID